MPPPPYRVAATDLALLPGPEAFRRVGRRRLWVRRSQTLVAGSRRFECCTSALTVEEAGRGHREAAARRLEALDGIAMLRVTEAVIALSDALIRERALPASAQNDAIHIAVSAVHGVDYLLTWNFRHLANAESRPLIREVCERQGYNSPEICTPSELMGGPEDV